MIARLRGRLVGRRSDGIVLDVGGVGYLVHATPSVLRRAEPGEELVVETHLNVREDALQLYGFADAGERELFEHFLSVSGVGPKVALAILSGSTPADLRRAIALEARLKRIYDGVKELIDAHRPDAVALEESFVGADARTALSVGQARGAVLVACAAAGVASREYSPNRVKSMVCGYGHADKAQIQRMVKTLLGLPRPPTPHHAADALAVAICHALAPPLLEATA